MPVVEEEKKEEMQDQGSTEKKEDDWEPLPPLICDVTYAGADVKAKGLKYTTTFHFEWTSSEGMVFEGNFMAKRLNLGELGQVGVTHSHLNGGESNINVLSDYIHEMIAFLQYSLVDFPDWWKPRELYDAIIIRKVYDHVRKWISRFF